MANAPKFPPCLLFVLTHIVFLGSAQAQELISPSGSVVQTDNIQLTWSLGEPAIATLPTPRGLVTQGFQQPILTIREIPHRMPFMRDLIAQVMPNPATSSVRILLAWGNPEVVQTRWHDVTGQFVDGGEMLSADGKLEWDVSGFAPGTYVLTITVKGLPPQSFFVTKVD